MKKLIILLVWVVAGFNVSAVEYHVSKNGDDHNQGSRELPFLTIQAAANVAIAGDVVTVHEGVYRERVDPIHSGLNDICRITYRAAEEEKVVIKGSEIVSGWEKDGKSVWKAVVPNSLFGEYNPFDDLVEGDWFNPEGIRHHTGEVFINGKALFEQNSQEGVRHPKAHKKAVDSSASLYTWYSEVGEENTTLWANFQDMDPNRELVEINMREACFYPGKTGINYITVSGFEMSQAATQWAAPTAEQIGLIGTHWSRGWIIEHNLVSNSKSVGITLGKDRATGQNVWMHNKLKDGATHYNEVIFRALETGWSREKIGSHTVRHNIISDCGQAGIVGSLGAAFSTIHDNHIYDIYTKRTYSGAEMGGIKIHASIDMLIEHNRIHDAFIGIWLDWMAQGTRVTRNLLYDNSHHDFFSEVNHGPYLVDNNLFLTETGLSIQDASEGGAFVHNLFAGRTKNFNVPNRVTPYHHSHSTKVVCLRNIRGGDNRFFNNIFVRTGDFPEEAFTDQAGQQIAIGYGLNGYDNAEYESFSDGNVFYNGAKPYKNESNSIQVPGFKPGMEIVETDAGLLLKIKFDKAVTDISTSLVTTLRLGSTIVSEAVFESRDGLPYRINTDYFGNSRDEDQPGIGPFDSIKEGRLELEIF
ncbi:MAG: right-handed parallel beta-helix repeat-containing protein [Bacteroidetes bacterium]|nr:right-handed parallel beta-helix repeat-containing protein [Bacteroidota bacterium]